LLVRKHRPHPRLVLFFFFFPLPWWERIKVRGKHEQLIELLLQISKPVFHTGFSHSSQLSPIKGEGAIKLKKYEEIGSCSLILTTFSSLYFRKTLQNRLT
jgi:hypothetical protein